MSSLFYCQFVGCTCDRPLTTFTSVFGSFLQSLWGSDWRVITARHLLLHAEIIQQFYLHSIKVRSPHDRPVQENWGRVRIATNPSQPRRQKGMDDQEAARAALLQVRTRYLFQRRLRGNQGRYGRARKISSTLGIDPQTAPAVASHCLL